MTEQASGLLKSCVFPFIYKDQLRNGCIPEDEEYPDATDAVIDKTKKEDDPEFEQKFWCLTDLRNQQDENRFEKSFYMISTDHKKL